jgi:oligopeptide transport system permease protein
VILQEAFLSFLGLGVQPPAASWGTLVSDGARQLALFPWLVAFPGVALSLTLLAFNFLGDGLRDALDPQDRQDVS